MKTQRILTIFVALGIFLSSAGFSPAALDAVAPIPETVCVQQRQVKGAPDLRKIGEEIGMNWRKLAELNGIPESMPWLVFPGQKLCLKYRPVLTRAPWIRIVQTVRDGSVVAEAYNFPENALLEVYLGRAGGAAGTLVGTLRIGSTPGTRGTFAIPAELRGQQKLQMRMLLPSKPAIQSSRHFYNMTSLAEGYSDQPKVSLSSFTRNQNVTITLANVPAGVTLEVLMGASKSRKIMTAGSLASGNGGSLSGTFAIPAAFANQPEIAVIVRCSALDYVGYVSFRQ